MFLIGKSRLIFTWEIHKFCAFFSPRCISWGLSCLHRKPVYNFYHYYLPKLAGGFTLLQIWISCGFHIFRKPKIFNKKNIRIHKALLYWQKFCMELRENPIHMATIPTTATLIQTLRTLVPILFLLLLLLTPPPRGYY